MESEYENIEYEREQVFGATKKRVLRSRSGALTKLASARGSRRSSKQDSYVTDDDFLSVT